MPRHGRLSCSSHPLSILLDVGFYLDLSVVRDSAHHLILHLAILGQFIIFFCDSHSLGGMVSSKIFICTCSRKCSFLAQFFSFGKLVTLFSLLKEKGLRELTLKCHLLTASHSEWTGGMNTKSKHSYYPCYVLDKVAGATCLCLHRGGGRSQAKRSWKIRLKIWLGWSELEGEETGSSLELLGWWMWEYAQRLLWSDRHRWAWENEKGWCDL